MNDHWLTDPEAQAVEYHDFDESLKRSHQADQLPIWEEMYRSAFPRFQTMVNYRQDGEHQRAGVDRGVILSTSEQILIDEKVRGRNKKTGIVYSDILLEYESDHERRKPGWVVKPLRAHYIAYAIAPLGRGYLLPVPALQACWLRNGDDWRKRFGLRKAPNRKHGRVWHTYNVPIPVDVLFRELGKCLRLSFTKMEIDE